MSERNHPTTLFFEEGALDKNGSVLKTLGERALILTGARSAVASGALADALQVLESNDQTFRIVDTISANPLVSVVRQAAETARSFGADFILAIGGGSVLDAGKAVSLLAAQPLTDTALFGALEGKRTLPLAAVGLTAGTGSEVTKIAILTEDATGRKRSIANACLYPVFSFADAGYTKSMNGSVTLSTALDALCHLLESWFSEDFDPAAEEDCLSGGKAALRLLHQLSESPLSYETDNFRRTMLKASLLGGYAIDRCRTAFPHLAGYALTEKTGLPHGLATALFLPVFLDLAEQHQPEKAEQLEAATGFSCSEIARLTDFLTQRELFDHPVAFTADVIEDQLARYESAPGRLRTPGKPSAEELLVLAQERLSLLLSD